MTLGGVISAVSWGGCWSVGIRWEGSALLFQVVPGPALY